MVDVLFLLLSIAGYYVFAGLATYAYAVVLNKQYTGTYLWNMDDTYIGICVYPQWLLFWLYWIVSKFQR